MRDFEEMGEAENEIKGENTAMPVKGKETHKVCEGTKHGYLINPIIRPFWRCNFLV